MKLLVCLTTFFLITYRNSSFASAKMIAEVTKIRGSITKLLPGATMASQVVLGDKFPEDTSILTGPKSFLKIKFIDNSEVNMGPESKIVISEMKSMSAPGIISLLKGRIRTQVEKNEKENGNKFFIRTRTAALGVRGTDFQTIYNPQNRMTSLLTYKGAVAMAKLDKDTHKALESGAQESTKEVVRDDVSNNLEVKDIPGKEIDEKKELQKLLAKKDVVIVPPGQNSFASDALKKTSSPVKISPVQLNALYKNNEFEEKNVINLRSGLEIQDVKLDLAQAPQTAPAEGFYNPKTGEFAPKAGGFIDQETGLYVAPDSSAVLDPATGTFRSSKTGDVDADTGQYVAPQGLVLDAKRGFILKDQAGSKPELLALREDMNKSIARDIVVGDLDGELALEQKSIKERFIRDRLSFTIFSGDEDIKLNKDKNLPYYQSSSQKVIKLAIDWQLSSSNRFAPLLGAAYSSVGYKNIAQAGHKQDSKGLFNLYFGLKYALSKRFNLYSKLMLNQAHYADQTANSPLTYYFKRLVLTRLGVGSDVELYKSDAFSFKVDAMIATSFRKRFNSLVISSGPKFQLKLLPEWVVGDKKSLGLGLIAGREENDLKNTFGTNAQERSYSSLFGIYTIEI